MNSPDLSSSLKLFSECDGKIVAEADRDLEPMHIFRRTVQYGLNHYPEYSKEEQRKRFFEHLDHKYSAHGYIRLWLPNSPNTENLKVIRDMINDRSALEDIFDTLFEEEKNASED